MRVPTTNGLFTFRVSQICLPLYPPFPEFALFFPLVSLDELVPLLRITFARSSEFFPKSNPLLSFATLCMCDASLLHLDIGFSRALSSFFFFLSVARTAFFSHPPSCKPALLAPVFSGLPLCRSSRRECSFLQIFFSRVINFFFFPCFYLSEPTPSADFSTNDYSTEPS